MAPGHKSFTGQHPLVVLFERLSPLFFWLRWFYPQAKGFSPAILLFCFVPQKILRINGRVGWPVHFTSRILYRKNVTVGPGSAPGLSQGNYIQARNGIEIGSNVMLGPGVGLISANHNPQNFKEWLPSDPIRIGDNVWIGMNSVVLPGVRIGDNVLIGANSVVSQDIPSNAIAVGSPCGVVREKPPYGSGGA